MYGTFSVIEFKMNFFFFYIFSDLGDLKTCSMFFFFFSFLLRMLERRLFLL